MTPRPIYATASSEPTAADHPRAGDARGPPLDHAGRPLGQAGVRAARHRRRAQPAARSDIPGGLWGRLVARDARRSASSRSSNYVINEVLDAPSDLSHPVKRHRPVPSGKVSIPLAYVQWIALMVVGVGLGLLRQRAVRDHHVRPLGDGLHLQHPAGPHEGPALPRRAVRVDQQPAAHARRLVHDRHAGLPAGVAAPQLLDGRLLLHGHQALRRVPRHRRSRPGRRLPQVVQLLHARSGCWSRSCSTPRRRCCSSARSSCATASS